jgi:hypothetical protein
MRICSVGHLAGATLSLVAVSLTACGPTPTEIETRPAEALSPALERLSLTIAVPLTKPDGPGLVTSGRTFGAGDLAFASLIGGEGFSVEIDDIVRSAVGQHIPGRIRVTAKIRIRNELQGTRMWTPTFPAPPDNSGGIFLFAIQAVAIESAGNVSAAGNEILVIPAGGGTVTVGKDWDGEPYDYVRSTFGTCGAGSATCARYERFDAPLKAGSVSEWRRIGFDVDASVRTVRLRMLLAADLANED